MKQIAPSNRKTRHAVSYVHDMQHYLGRIVSIFAHLVFFLFFTRFFIFDIGISDGVSMSPTINDNRIFFIEKLSPLFFPFSRYEIIQHADPEDSQRLLLKRIIGLPGEVVVFKNNGIFIRTIHGEEYQLNESYLSESIINTVSFGALNEYQVPDHSYFVLGDNRQYSRDSRVYGSIHRKLITGKYVSLDVSYLTKSK